MIFALLVVLAGCTEAFGIQRLHRPDAAVDAPIDAPLPPCAPVAVYADTFDTSPPCSQWGFVDNSSASVSVAGGQLVIVPDASNASTRGGCLSSGNAPFDPDTGIFIESAMPGAPNEYKYAGIDQLTIAWDPTNVYFSLSNSQFAMVPFGANTRWTRVRPTADRTMVIAETAPDGLTWTTVGSVAFAAPTTARILFYGGTFAPIASPPPITFDGFDVCPSG
jgi:hypothetical protein